MIKFLKSYHFILYPRLCKKSNDTGKCLYYNLFRLGALLDHYIPPFIYYKIELNNKLLYSNVKIQNTQTRAYHFDRTYHINDFTQLRTSLAIDNIEWDRRESEIKKPFWILTIFFTASIVLIYSLLYKSSRHCNNIYKSYYYDKYVSQLELEKLTYQQELKNYKASLMKKIWDNDFNKQKDLEINYLFAQKANQIAFGHEPPDAYEEKIKNKQVKRLNDKVPCSIVLYQDDKTEEVNTELLINLFKNRFAQEDDNIALTIISDLKTVNFSSSAALYQIIYSILSYLFFVLKKQPLSTKYNITLTISGAKEELKLCFEYDGYSIVSEKELVKMSGHFFKTHANPFLLNPNQVFSIFKNNGYNLRVEHERCNIIEIKPQKQPTNNKVVKMPNNVILLTPFTKKNND